jgi:hypothetical protein
MGGRLPFSTARSILASTGISGYRSFGFVFFMINIHIIIPSANISEYFECSSPCRTSGGMKRGVPIEALVIVELVTREMPKSLKTATEFVSSRLES